VKGGLCSPILNLNVMAFVQIVPCLDAAGAERVLSSSAVKKTGTQKDAPPSNATSAEGQFPLLIIWTEDKDQTLSATLLSGTLTKKILALGI
jgi:hypothetical protein